MAKGFRKEGQQDPRYEALAEQGKVFDYSEFMEAYRGGSERFYKLCEQAFLARITPDNSLKTLAEEMATGSEPAFVSTSKLSKLGTLYEVFGLEAQIPQERWVGVDVNWTSFYPVASFLKNNVGESVEKWFEWAASCTPKELRDKMREAAGKGAITKEPRMLETSTWELLASTLEALREDVGESVSKDELLEKLLTPVKEMGSEARREWWARLHGEPGKPLGEAVWGWVRENYETQPQQDRFVRDFLKIAASDPDAISSRLLDALDTQGYGYDLDDVVKVLSGGGKPPHG